MSFPRRPVIGGQALAAAYRFIDDGRLVRLLIALGNYISEAIGSLIGEAGPLPIFGGIATVGVVSARVLWAVADPLVRWVHAAEDKSATFMQMIESPAN